MSASQRFSIAKGNVLPAMFASIQDLHLINGIRLPSIQVTCVGRIGRGFQGLVKEFEYAPDQSAYSMYLTKACLTEAKEKYISFLFDKFVQEQTHAFENLAINAGEEFHVSEPKMIVPAHNDMYILFDSRNIQPGSEKNLDQNPQPTYLTAKNVKVRISNTPIPLGDPGLLEGKIVGFDETDNDLATRTELNKIIGKTIKIDTVLTEFYLQEKNMINPDSPFARDIDFPLLEMTVKYNPLKGELFCNANDPREPQDVPFTEENNQRIWSAIRLSALEF